MTQMSVALILFAFATSTVSAAEFGGTSRCGDCWCITEDGICPYDTTGITDKFSATDELFATFELTNDPDFLKLQGPSGGACYPFQDGMGPIANYPESNEEQCVIPSAESDAAVCAYTYEASSTSCEGRKYSIRNFDSANDAMMANAHIVHEGGCGVCSSAQDFGARIKTYGTLETESIICATTYTFTRDFPALVQCYEKLGFTNACSSLWAHFAATNGSTCALQCIPGPSGITELNGPAPECAPSPCLQCQVNFRGVFDDIAGMEFAKAGITERIARKCQDFSRVIHDPCIALDSGSIDSSSGTVNVEPPITTTVDPPDMANTNDDSSATNHTNVGFVITMMVAHTLIKTFD